MTGPPYQFSKPAEPWPWSTEILAAKLDHLDPGASLKLDIWYCKQCSGRPVTSNLSIGRLSSLPRNTVARSPITRRSQRNTIRER